MSPTDEEGRLVSIVEEAAARLVVRAGRAAQQLQGLLEEGGLPERETARVMEALMICRRLAHSARP